MSKTQRRIRLAGLIVAVLLVLFPPRSGTIVKDNAQDRPFPTTRGFLFARYPQTSGTGSVVFVRRIDISRLGLELLFVGLCCASVELVAVRMVEHKAPSKK